MSYKTSFRAQRKTKLNANVVRESPEGLPIDYIFLKASDSSGSSQESDALVVVTFTLRRISGYITLYKS